MTFHDQVDPKKRICPNANRPLPWCVKNETQRLLLPCFLHRNPVDFRHLFDTGVWLPGQTRFASNPDTAATSGTGSCQYAANPTEPNTDQDQHVHTGNFVNIVPCRSGGEFDANQPAFPIGRRNRRFAALVVAT